MPARDLCDPKDAIFFQLRNRVKSIMVNQRSVTPLIYEEWIVDEGSFAKTPMHIHLPAELLDPLVECREYASELLEGVTTLAEATSILTKHEDTLVDMERGYSVDLVWLREEAPKRLKSQVDKLVMECFPNVGQEMSFETSLAKLRGVQRNPKALALGEDYTKELAGIHDIIKYLGQGFPPKTEQAAKSSDLTKAVLGKAGNFLRIEAPLAISLGSAAPDGEYLQGTVAVNHLFKTLHKDIGDGPLKDPEKAAALKQFRWLLKLDDQDILSKWLKSVKGASGSVAIAALKDGKETVEGASSSSSGAIVLANESLSRMEESDDAKRRKFVKKSIISSFYSSMLAKSSGPVSEDLD